ncbi:hypothetical protein G6O67_002279 [Ophiocordyceps sinensis]|uniref:Nucleotide-binding, alpha-beta plait n=1 Tax=Ophiocordyceps sinensis TaxID=72228 RepID=A0A8H4PTY9_9HYPO|nr:hypothetical protein G6O67_002279 [Ophiocordyceps sinensis]
MDLDIEMGDVEQDVLGVDPGRADDILQPDEPEEPGEVAEDVPQIDDGDDSSAVIPTKVHVRGLNTLHTDDVKAYVRTHFGLVDRVEWIDDVSANLVFGSEPTAREAIVALSSIEVADASALAVGETLPAKPFDGKPEVSLQVRFALKSDKKEAGAAMRSRYYLIHPEHDPEERRRRQHDNRSRYRDRDGDFRRGDRGRRGSNDPRPETFEASMYDDAPSQPRRYSDPEERSRAYSKEVRGKENHVKELFRDRAPRRDRNRDHARAIKGRLPDNNGAKELFPSKSSGRGGQLDQLERSIGSASLREEDMPKVVATPTASTAGMFSIRGLASRRCDGDSGGFSIKGAAANAKELFPDRLGGGNAGKELLDTKRSSRRHKAQDLFL